LPLIRAFELLVFLPELNWLNFEPLEPGFLRIVLLTPLGDFGPEFSILLPELSIFVEQLLVG